MVGEDERSVSLHAGEDLVDLVGVILLDVLDARREEVNVAESVELLELHEAHLWVADCFVHRSLGLFTQLSLDGLPHQGLESL